MSHAAATRQLPAFAMLAAWTFPIVPHPMMPMFSAAPCPRSSPRSGFLKRYYTETSAM